MPANRIQEYWSASAIEDVSHSRSDETYEDSFLRNWLDRVELCIQDHPRTTVVAALTVGVLVGWVRKRR